MSYNFSIAKEKVNNNDMLRFACLFLNRRGDGTIDYDKATAEFGAKSVDSMRVCTNSALKKIENAGGKTGVSASTSATPKKGGGRKRKVTPADDDDEQVASPTKKKGRKTKKTANTPVDSAAEDAAVKGEPVTDGEEE